MFLTPFIYLFIFIKVLTDSLQRPFFLKCYWKQNLRLKTFLPKSLPNGPKSHLLCNLELQHNIGCNLANKWTVCNNLCWSFMTGCAVITVCKLWNCSYVTVILTWYQLIIYGFLVMSQEIGLMLIFSAVVSVWGLHWLIFATLWL